MFLNCTYVIHVALEVTRQTVLDERSDHQGAVAVADWSWEQTFTVLKVHTCVFVDGATLYGLLIFFLTTTVYLVFFLPKYIIRLDNVSPFSHELCVSVL